MKIGNPTQKITEKPKKQLPPHLTEEELIQIDYAIAKWMEEREPIAISKQFPTNWEAMLTVKTIKEKGLQPQIQWHIRIKDKTTERIFDLDVYTPTKAIRQMERLRKQMEHQNIPFHAIPSSEPKGIHTFQIGTKTRQYNPIKVTYFYKGRNIRTTWFDVAT